MTADTPRPTPTTQAGRAFIGWLEDGTPFTHDPDWTFRAAILAIEAEARDATGLREALDARRYQRLRLLGAAPYGSKQLDNSTVLRFTGLDAFVDADLATHPDRGEAHSTPLAAAPPEPRWPSVEALTLAINAVSPISDDPQDPMTEDERAMIGMAREEFARRILAALREGGQRP